MQRTCTISRRISNTCTTDDDDVDDDDDDDDDDGGMADGGGGNDNVDGDNDKTNEKKMARSGQTADRWARRNGIATSATRALRQRWRRTGQST